MTGAARPGMVAPAVQRPAVSTPALPVGASRRSSYADVLLGQGAAAGQLQLSAGIRDVVRRADGSVVTTGEARLDVTLSADRRVRLLSSEPPLRDPERLRGAPAGSGFRALARQALSGPPDAPLAQLLDDVPVALMVSGYGPLRAGLDDPARRIRLAHVQGMTDVCSGWRAEGSVFEIARAAGALPVPELVPAPRLDPVGDPAAAPLPAPQPGTLRRRRRIDVRPGFPATIDAMFRDTWTDETGEGVLHEYGVAAVVDKDGRVVELIAEPRVLPWQECPLAAAPVAALVGLPVAAFAVQVADLLVGPRSCTHLNDLLRSLACVPRLLDARP